LAIGFDQLWDYYQQGHSTSSYAPYFEFLSLTLGRLYALDPLPPVSNLNEIADSYLSQLKTLHSDPELSPYQITFVEFMYGLMLVMPLLLAGNLHYAPLILDPSSNQGVLDSSPFNPSHQSMPANGPFWASQLHQVTLKLHQMSQQVYHHYQTTPSLFWQQTQEHLSRQPELASFFDRLVGIRYLPDASDHKSRSVLGHLQTLHWEGFGGTGAWFDDLMCASGSPRSSLFLDPSLYRRCCLGWHTQPDPTTSESVELRPVKNVAKKGFKSLF